VDSDGVGSNFGLLFGSFPIGDFTCFAVAAHDILNMEAPAVRSQLVRKTGHLAWLAPTVLNKLAKMVEHEAEHGAKQIRRPFVQCQGMLEFDYEEKGVKSTFLAYGACLCRNSSAVGSHRVWEA